MKKNILILSPDSPIQGMGGLGVHLKEVLKRIDTNQYCVNALCFGVSDTSFQESQVGVYGIRIVDYPAAVNNDSYLSTFLTQSSMVSRAMDLVSKGIIPTPDVIHAMDWSTVIAAKELAKVYKAKIVFAIHLSVDGCNTTPLVAPEQAFALSFAENIEFDGCNSADHILQVSQSYAHRFPFMVFEHKTTICPNGVDYEHFKTTQKPVWPGKCTKKILYVGRIAPMKNVLNLVLGKLPSGMDLYIMGGNQGSDPNLLERVKRVCDEDEHKFFLGPKYDQEKINYMADADLIVMPSIHEPFGMVALEALAAGQNGKTLLASSFVDGLGDFLSPNAAIECGTTLESIQDAIAYWNSLSKSKKQTMRNAGRQLAQDYSWSNTVSIIQSTWEQC